VLPLLFARRANGGVESPVAAAVICMESLGGLVSGARDGDADDVGAASAAQRRFGHLAGEKSCPGDVGAEGFKVTQRQRKATPMKREFVRTRKM
jgi:hypothetical protein